MASDPHDIFTQQPAEELAALADERRLEGRKTSVHRMQIGLFGLGAMVLLVGLASIIQNSAAETQASSVPVAASNDGGGEEIESMQDPLAAAGVVPELPAEAAPAEDELEQLDPGEDLAEALGADDIVGAEVGDGQSSDSSD